MQSHEFHYMLGSAIGYIIKEKSLKPLINYIFRYKKISEFLDTPESEIKAYFDELNNSKFIDKLTTKLDPYSNIQTGSMMSPLRGPMLYVMMRVIQPKIIVETGVASGASSSFLLKALQKNNSGHLHSIDLPASPENDPDVRLPEYKKPGWLVDDELKDRWTYHEGKSSDLLKPLLEKLSNIDMFIHDSLHTYENMKFEYTTAWPYIKNNGFLASDDIKWNPAFLELIKEKNPSKILDLYSFGILKK